MRRHGWNDSGLGGTVGEATVNAVMVVVESATVGNFFLNGFGVQ